MAFRVELAATGDPAKAISSLIAAAVSRRTFTPPVETGDYAKRGPNAAQGLVVVGYDANSAPRQGANRLVIKTPIAFKSNVRLAIDSRVALVWGIPSNSQIFDWSNGLTNVSIAGVGGMWYYDSNDALKGVDRRRLINFGNVSNWLVEQVESYQVLGRVGSVVSGSAVFPFHGASESTSARDGIYRFHKNSGSPSGYGPNQIASAFRVTVTDLTSNGGTVLRLETDGSSCGVHGMVARRLTGSNGNRVVAFSAHDAHSDNIVVTDIKGTSMFEGIRINQQQGTGRFTKSQITTGNFTAGNTAQDPSKGGAVGNGPSHSVINANPGDVTIHGIKHSGYKTPGSYKNPDGSSPYV